MIILEIQHSNNGSTAVLHEVVADRNTAEQTYHNKLSYAAVSKVDVHTVAMITDEGVVNKKETYYHTEEPSE